MGLTFALKTTFTFFVKDSHYSVSTRNRSAIYASKRQPQLLICHLHLTPTVTDLININLGLLLFQKMGDFEKLQDDPSLQKPCGNTRGGNHATLGSHFNPVLCKDDVEPPRAQAGWHPQTLHCQCKYGHWTIEPTRERFQFFFLPNELYLEPNEALYAL